MDNPGVFSYPFIQDKGRWFSLGEGAEICIASPYMPRRLASLRDQTQSQSSDTLCADSIKGWHGLEESGATLEYSESAAASLLQKYPHFKELVETLALVRSLEVEAEILRDLESLAQVLVWKLEWGQHAEWLTRLRTETASSQKVDGLSSIFPLIPRIQDHLLWYWWAFWELSRTRRDVLSPLEYTEIKAWCDLQKFTDLSSASNLLFYVMALDGIYIQAMNKKLGQIK